MPRKSSHFTARFTLFLLLTAAILGVAWQARRQLGLPVPRSLPLPRQNEAAARAERELTVSADAVYSLQLGAFSAREAADALAAQYQPRGAAGYVLFEDGAYRVLAAGYPTRAAAQAVLTRLRDQGISACIHAGAREAVTLRAGGTAAQVEALDEALQYLNGLGGKLYSLSDALDNRTIEAADAADALRSERVTCAALRERLRAAFSGSLPASLSPLDETLAALADESAGEGAARTGAALKRGQLTVFFGLRAFCEKAAER